MIFSVIIPLHDKEPYISRTIQSVLDQTYKDFELIIVDDASSDNGLAQARLFADKRIRFFSHKAPSWGAAKTRNYGIQQAQNNWIAFLDADDEWNPNFLQSLANLHKRFPDANILCANWEHRYPQHSLRSKFSKEHQQVSLFTWDDFLENITRNQWPLCTGSAVLRRENLIEAGLFPEGEFRFGEDRDTWLRTMRLAQRWAWTPDVGLIYHCDIMSQTTRMFKHEIKGNYLCNTIKYWLSNELNGDQAIRFKKVLHSVELVHLQDCINSGTLSWKILFGYQGCTFKEMLELAKSKIIADLRRIKKRVLHP